MLAEAAGAIREPAEGDAAGGRAEQGHRHHGAAHGRGEMQFALDLAEDEGIEHHIHAVEHPAERGGQQSSLLFAGSFREPGEDSVQGRSLI
jgi:hypothetical protein